MGDTWRMNLHVKSAAASIRQWVCYWSHTYPSKGSDHDEHGVWAVSLGEPQTVRRELSRVWVVTMEPTAKPNTETWGDTFQRSVLDNVFLLVLITAIRWTCKQRFTTTILDVKPWHCFHEISLFIHSPSIYLNVTNGSMWSILLFHSFFHRLSSGRT